MSLRPGVNATVRVFSKCSLHSQRKRRWRGGLLPLCLPPMTHLRQALFTPGGLHPFPLRRTRVIARLGEGPAKPFRPRQLRPGVEVSAERVSKEVADAEANGCVCEPPGSWTSSSARRGSITTVFVLGGCYHTLTTSPLADRRNLESYSSVAEPKHAGANVGHSGWLI